MLVYIVRGYHKLSYGIERGIILVRILFSDAHLISVFVIKFPSILKFNTIMV